MVRVAMISPCMGQYGGLEGFVISLAKGIGVDSGCTVDLLFKQVSGFEIKEDMLKQIAATGVKARFCSKASRELWHSIRGADLIHVQNPCPDVVLMARMAQKPLLINVINHSRGGRSLHGWLWKLCLRLAHKRFYISDFVRRTWENTVAPWQNSRVVFPICDLAPSEPKLAEQRSGFTFVSRWIENKGLDVLLEAYAQAGLDPLKWPLRLLGDGPLRPRIEARVKELGLHHVEMPGFVSDRDKWEAIRSSKFVVIPPHTNEDFGLVAIEARHLGVPCIVSRDGGLPEAAGSDAMICEPGSVNDLASKLREASSMTLAEYEVRASATHKSLASELVRPEFYADVYRGLAMKQ